MIAGSFRCYVPQTVHDHESALPDGSRVGVLRLVGLEGHGADGTRVRAARGVPVRAKRGAGGRDARGLGGGVAGGGLD